MIEHTSPSWRRHLILLAATIGVLLTLYRADAADMVQIWWTSSTYGHCLFILPLVGWLIWQRRREVALVEPRAWLPGLLSVAITVFAWLIGEAGSIALIRHASLVAMMQATVLTILGPAAARALMFPLFYLVFLVPFGDELVSAMQTLTARMTMALLDLFAIPARLDGVFITTSFGWFEVAEACAGIRFLVAMVAFGALVANVCFRDWRRRIVFMALCIVAPILANGVRAFGTIYVAKLTSVESATGFDHIVYGWLFFALVLGTVLAVSWRFFDRQPHDRWVGEMPVNAAPTRSPGILALSTIVVALLPLLWNAIISANGRRPLPNGIVLPEVPGWQRVPVKAAYAWVPRFDGADHRLFGRYREASGREVDLAIALYASQGEGREIVSFGQGAIDPASKWAWASQIPALRGAKGVKLVAPGKITRIAMTYYVVAGRATGDAMTVKLNTLKARLLGTDQSAAVVILSSEGTDGGGIASFASAIGPIETQAERLIATARGG